LANEQVMKRYRSPAYKGETAAFCEKYAGTGGKVAEFAGDNPLCGDSIQMAVWVTEDGVIGDACYDGYGCSLCIASAEALLEQAIHRPAAEVLSLGTPEVLAGLGGITVGRTRMKCVELSIQTLKKALQTNE